MRKSLLIAAAFAPLVAVALVAVPAIAQSGAQPSGEVVAQSSAPPLDLEAIPVQPVSGPMAVGIATDDEEGGATCAHATNCDDGSMIEADYHGAGHESELGEGD